MNFMINESEQKLRGGYYTPLDLATYIWQWVAHGQPKNLLEPSCGDGVFLQAVSDGRPNWDVSIIGFELYEEEAAKARSRVAGARRVKASIRGEDFLAWAISQMAAGQCKYDAVVGNPPFIRYQYLPEESQAKAEAIFRLLHLPF